MVAHCPDPVNLSREQDHDFHLGCSKEGFSEQLGLITPWLYPRVPFARFSHDVSESFGQGEDDVHSGT